MDMNRLTQKSQEALQEAQTIAIRLGHTEVDGEHLLLALLDGRRRVWCRGCSARPASTPTRLRGDVEAELRRRPQVTGPGAAPGQVFVTQRLAGLLDAAEREATRLKDEYVSVEHLLLALVERGLGTAPAGCCRPHGLTRDAFLGALTQVRGNQRVTSATPEGSLRGAGEVRAGPGRRGPQRHARPGDRPGRRDPPGDPDPVAARRRTTRC